MRPQDGHRRAEEGRGQVVCVVVVVPGTEPALEAAGHTDTAFGFSSIY